MDTVVLFITLYKVVLTFESGWNPTECDHSNGSYQVVLSFGAVYYVVQGGFNFWVCGWNPKVWYSKESYGVVLSCGTAYDAGQGGFPFWVCGWNPKAIVEQYVFYVAACFGAVGIERLTPTMMQRRSI